MSMLVNAEHAVVRRIEGLRIMRENTHELGLDTPVISLEIATLQIVAGGINFVRAIIPNGEEKQ